MSEISIKAVSYDKLNMSSFHGVTVKTTLAKLKKVLGEPHAFRGVEDKVACEWLFEITEDYKHYYCSVYDYKEYDWQDAGCPENKCIEWHIGGFNDEGQEIMRQYINKNLKNL